MIGEECKFCDVTNCPFDEWIVGKDYSFCPYIDKLKTQRAAKWNDDFVTDVIAREPKKKLKKQRGKEIAEEHWKWFGGWVRRLEFPMDHKEFVEIVGDAYKDAMEHGYKHGKNDKE